MSTGYGWEGLGQVCATLLGAHHVPARPCSGIVYLGRYNKCSTLPFYLYVYCVTRDLRLRQFLGVRYDAIPNVFDWDFNMKLVEKGVIICFFVAI